MTTNLLIYFYFYDTPDTPDIHESLDILDTPIRNIKGIKSLKSLIKSGINPNNHYLGYLGAAWLRVRARCNDGLTDLRGLTRSYGKTGNRKTKARKRLASSADSQDGR